MANCEKKSNNEWPKRLNNSNAYKKERPISLVYPVIDNDLARDNIENDLTSADMQDLENQTKF